MTLRLTSDNGSWLREATKTLSTVELLENLREHYIVFHKYETALLFNGKSEVVETYDTEEEAIEGHKHFEKIYKVAE